MLLATVHVQYFWNLTCKGTLLQGFTCLRPPWPSLLRPYTPLLTHCILNVSPACKVPLQVNFLDDNGVNWSTHLSVSATYMVKKSTVLQLYIVERERENKEHLKNNKE